MKRTLLISALSIPLVGSTTSASIVGLNVTLLVSQQSPATVPTTVPVRPPIDLGRIKPTPPGPLAMDITEVFHPRGPQDADVIVTVLAPPDVGLTSSDRPALYFHLSNATSHPLIATLSRVGEPAPVKTWRLSGAARGFYRLDLGVDDPPLEPGCEYEWVVAVRPDERYPSKDVVAMGFIRHTTAVTDSGPGQTVVDDAIYDRVQRALDHIERDNEQYRASLLNEIELVERETTSAAAAAVRTRSRS